MSLPSLFDILPTPYISHLLGLLEYLLAQPQLYDCGYAYAPHLGLRSSSSAAQSGLSFMENDENNFKVSLDVQPFAPNEVSVKVVDGYIVVDGKHEERSDEHSFVSRQFTRRYKIPDDVDPDAIVSTLSSDGVLSIKAPKKINEMVKSERSVQIIQTNEPSINTPQIKEKENVDGTDQLQQQQQQQ